MLLLGFDEAGYGPNLGPCVLGGTRLVTESSEACLFTLLEETVSQTSVSAESERIHVADSKEVHQSSKGIGPLERSALVLAQAFGLNTNSLFTLIQQLTGCLPEAFARQPWYEEDLALPLVHSADQLQQLSDQLQQNAKQAHVVFDQLSCMILCPELWNQQLQVHSSKGEVLSIAHFEHLLKLSPQPESNSAKAIMDRHGGRRRYDNFLQEIYPQAFIIRQQESAECSCYRVGKLQLTIQSRAEEKFEVAVSSLIAKYIREALMMTFNRYWQQRIPELKPTKGYPQDARRFLGEIETVLNASEIPRDILWRNK